MPRFPIINAMVWQVIWAAVAASTVPGDDVEAVCRVHDF